jgi:hypothetical protein
MNAPRVLSVLALLFLLATPLVLAVTVNTSIPGITSDTNTTTAPCSMIFGFYNFAMVLGGVLALGAITYGGVKYTMAAGNPAGQSEGKAWIKDALLGLLLLAGAYLILNIINPNLTKCGLPPLTPVGGVVAPPTNPCVGVLTCAGGDGTCDGSCPLDTNGDTQACRLVGGTLQRQCVPSAAGVRCGGAINGSCPIDPSTGREEPCTDTCGFPSSCYACVVSTPGGPVCGVPLGLFGSCAQSGTSCQKSIDYNGVTTYHCCDTASPFTCH